MNLNEFGLMYPHLNYFIPFSNPKNNSKFILDFQPQFCTNLTQIIFRSLLRHLLRTKVKLLIEIIVYLFTFIITQRG